METDTLEKNLEIIQKFYPTAAYVYLRMWNKKNSENWFFFTADEISQIFAKCEATIISHLNILNMLKLITWEKKSGQFFVNLKS